VAATRIEPFPRSPSRFVRSLASAIIPSAYARALFPGREGSPEWSGPVPSTARMLLAPLSEKEGRRLYPCLSQGLGVVAPPFYPGCRRPRAPVDPPPRVICKIVQILFAWFSGS